MPTKLILTVFTIPKSQFKLKNKLPWVVDGAAGEIKTKTSSYHLNWGLTELGNCLAWPKLKQRPRTKGEY